MSYEISNHAAALRFFLTELNANRNTLICNYSGISKVLDKLKLTGKEERPFTDEEIQIVQSHYSYFKDYFTTKEPLWITFDKK